MIIIERPGYNMEEPIFYNTTNTTNNKIKNSNYYFVLLKAASVVFN